MPHPATLLDAIQATPEPDSVALICVERGRQITYRELLAQVLQVASALRDAGIGPGEAVSIAETNTVEFVVAFLGVTLARAVAAPLNSAYTEDEFRFYMEDAASKLLIVPKRGNKHAEAAAAGLNVPIATFSISTVKGALRNDLSAKSGGMTFIPQGGPPTMMPPHGEDVALFLHTSGTTSKPKGVPLTHANLAASLANIRDTYELTPADRSLLVMPLFHVHGLMAGLLAPFLAGAAVVVPAGGRFSAAAFWKDACKFGVTFYTAVPTIHQILLSRAKEEYPAHSPPPLRFIRSCSSSLAAPTLHKLEATFHVPVLEAYAMTEAAHQMTSNPLPKNGPHKAGTVGAAQGSVRVAILDDRNQKVPVGQIGEVCIQGPNVTKGYLNNPKANAEAYAGGWFHTGDQGFLDEEGFLTLTGRLKELINRGGEKISPLEVDSALLGHPLVAEAVSFAAPSEKYGEIVAAAVVLSQQPGDPAAAAADIRKFAATKLARFKVPEHIFITDRLPKTATGKIQRRHMVAHFMGGGGGGAAGGGAAGSGSGGQASQAAAAAPGKPLHHSKL